MSGTNRPNPTCPIVRANCPWAKRNAHASLAMPDGSIVILGGYDTAGGYKNDVWQSTDGGYLWGFKGKGPANSPDQNPVHTYTKPGSCTVSLLVANASGSHQRMKVRYVTVGEPVPPQTEFYVYAEGVGMYHGTMDDLSLGKTTPEEFYNLMNGL